METEKSKSGMYKMWQFHIEGITSWMPLFVLADFYLVIRDLFIYHQAYGEFMFYLFL